ncbi:DUF3822 family protein [Spirosoma sp. KUDC1026]|nr:DUF3822 family protein [Spirosoma sp. KUDC1026]
MLTPTILIRADSFEPTQVGQSVLCLEIGRDRLRFMVQNKQREVGYLEEYTFPSMLTERPLTEVLPEVFQNHPVLSAGPWQEIRISLNSPSFTLVPQPLYRKEYAGSYLALMRGSALPAHEFAQAHLHENEGFLSVFNLSHPLADYFAEIYPLQPLRFVHQTSALIQATADLDKRSLTPQGVWLYFEDEFVTVICRQDHKLHFCNRFGYKNPQDLTYYILYVLDEQQMNPAEVPVTLYGEITPFADSFAELSRFLAHLSFGQTPPSLRLDSAFDDVPEHRYLSMYGLTLLTT